MCVNVCVYVSIYKYCLYLLHCNSTNRSAPTCPSMCLHVSTGWYSPVDSSPPGRWCGARCRYTPLTLLLHYSYTLLILILHYSYTVITPLFRRSYIIVLPLWHITHYTLVRLFLPDCYAAYTLQGLADWTELRETELYVLLEPRYSILDRNINLHCFLAKLFFNET
jgi:hypothetical protein